MPETNNERLVEFLYILARDELPIGTIEGILFDHVAGGKPDEYCNVWLEGWARNVAERLTDESLPVVNYNNMYKPAGTLNSENEGWDAHYRVTGGEAKAFDDQRPSYPVRVEVVTSGQL